ncbi:DNA-binding response regulator [Agromyces rhizosphaerae]|uniref:DNA-binding response regulator n=1 Tax=Agromyces rhizosphaerae TaxID=88374 RepID=A0A9W6D157_9MICO|nr:response regulator transcription factor [Agromyces rhizosphaerae]GLI28944.1 DNA-binding response regulator [Agromyces rhizosphaerae]
MSGIRVLLVDDHPVVRTGLRAVLGTSGSVDVVGVAATGEEAVTLARLRHPQVVLCDLRLGEGMDGIRTTAALRKADPSLVVVILTTFDRDAEVLAAIEAGASGYLLKDASPEQIVAGVRRAAAGGTVLSPALSARVNAAKRAPRVNLTERELDVLRALDTGASNREIAKRLFVSEATVKTHLVHVYDKLGVDSRTRASAVAREVGLL